MAEGRASTGHDGFTAGGRAVTKELAAELRAQAKRAQDAAKAEAELDDLLEAIAKLPDEGDHALATRLHELIMAAVPTLAPPTSPGIPAYAFDGEVLRFVQLARKFEIRFTTLARRGTASVIRR